MGEEGPQETGLSISLGPEQAEDLGRALTLAKAFASPHRLALLGALAGRLPDGLTTDELAAVSPRQPVQIERDLRQLADAGLILVEEWSATGPGREPRPARVVFNRDYMLAMSRVIAMLNRLARQVTPPEHAGPADERARTRARFMHNGRLLSYPTHHRLQLYVLEEVAKAFDPDRDYTEREVDAILKEVYEYDHCTLRRALVDMHFLHRDHGIYARSA